MTIGKIKFWLFLRSRSRKSVESFFLAKKNWTKLDGTIDFVKEILFILANKREWLFVLQRPGEEMQHCGAFVHCVGTIVEKTSSHPMGVSIGYQLSSPNTVLSYMENVPDEERGFQVKGQIKPATTEQEIRNWQKIVLTKVEVSRKELTNEKRKRDESEEQRLLTLQTKKKKKSKQGKDGRFFKTKAERTIDAPGDCVSRGIAEGGGR